MNPKTNGSYRADALYKEALSLARGGRRADLPRCLALLQAASDRGDPKATYAIATWYLHGHVVRKSFKKGFGLLYAIRDSRIRGALFDLALCFESGRGVEKNLRMALKYYKKAASLGDADPKCELARCLYYGIGVSRNQKAAAHWYRRAARQGHRDAQLALSYLYERGLGVRSSRRWSDYWHSKATSANQR